jgi:hypothetical protein
MASIADVESAMGISRQESENVVVDIHNSYGSVGNEFVIFKLKGNQKKGVYIDGTDDVINPKTGKSERIRLLTGISSIWMSDQKDVDKDYIRNNRRSLEFKARICRINKMDTAALEFARMCNSNLEVKNRLRAPRFEFFEYDPAKQAEESLKKEMLELEMAIKAKDMDSDTLKKYASFIGVHLVNELAQVKPESALRQEVMLYAKKNPTVFQAMVDNVQEIEIHWQIKSAIISNQIDIAKQPGSAYWGSGGFITKMASKMDPVKQLTELAMTNTTEGREFLSKLKSISK